MASISQQQVEEALKTVKYPGFSRDIVSFGLVKEIKIEGSNLHVLLEHGIDDLETLRAIQSQVEAALEGIDGVGESYLELRGKASAPGGQKDAGAKGQGHDHGADHAHGDGHGHGAPGASQDPWAGQKPLPGVTAIVAVASAKGGVGKSTVATNLAASLSRNGLSVGLMDADVYGPSLPTMMGIDAQPTVDDDRKINPVIQDGVATMSMGYLVPPDKAMIWRGPMVMGAVTQFLTEVNWGELDVLLVDMPPGTGDAQLTLAQKVPLAGVVMVTTPQDVALIDVVRGIQMFEETKVPIIGVVENMSGHVCSQCGHEDEIFGKGGGKRTSDRFGVPFLGAVPIEASVRISGDEGKPVVVSHPDSHSAKAFEEIASLVKGYLAERAAKAVG